MIHRWREYFGIGIVVGGTGSILLINLMIDQAIDRMRISNKKYIIKDKAEEQETF